MDSSLNNSSRRILSIDALRGFDMFWIIGGSELASASFALSSLPWAQGIASQFSHSAWNGFTFYDLIFPLFLFIVGLVIPFSLAKYRNDKNTDFKHAYPRIILRAILLFFLGLCINGFLDLNFAAMRWPGVLQRIAICYLLAAILTLHVPIRLQFRILAITVFVILAGYWIIFKFVLAPGATPAEYLSIEKNLAGYIDRLLIPGRLYYKFGDNEGILSTLPALATTLIGVLTGNILKTSRTQIYKILWMLLCGAVFIITGIVWAFDFPLNKILWTSSYVLVSGGCSMLLLCLFYWLIDYKGYKKWAFPFMVIGMNAITIYVIQGLFDFGILVNIVIHGFSGYLGFMEKIFFLICVIALKWFFLFFLYKKKVFLKI
ncbi:MAG: acyltransferase family protein [Candidatus Humimicrobiaceae bacterium]